MFLQLGQVPTVIISSSKAAELFLKTHDIVFASRPKIQASELMDYGSVLIGEKAALVGEVVNVSDVVENLVENIMYKMILGRSKYEQFDLKGLVQQVMILIGAFDLADYIPWLGVFDLQGLTRAFKKTSKSLDEVLETILRDHEQIDNVDTIHNEDFIDTLLSIMHQTNDLENEQNHVIDRTTIKAIIQDIIMAGIDTSAVVIEWTLFELLRNSRVMKKLQDEIENEVGHNTMVEEKDLKKFE
ncbi:unnamed protein product [Vicia faba]|uniref:Cytochrome P450 n=1 Tax=Vicia faba TaxID=3906 RepID=A0AAV0YKV1_VICFA|nr:unnamed protein product [Vicia faba]